MDRARLFGFSFQVFRALIAFLSLFSLFGVLLLLPLHFPLKDIDSADIFSGTPPLPAFQAPNSERIAQVYIGQFSSLIRNVPDTGPVCILNPKKILSWLCFILSVPCPDQKQV